MDAKYDRLTTNPIRKKKKKKKRGVTLKNPSIPSTSPPVMQFTQTNLFVKQFIIQCEQEEERYLQHWMRKFITLGEAKSKT